MPEESRRRSHAGGVTPEETAAARVLRPGGSLVFVIGHPCFLAPEATTAQGDDGRPGRLVVEYLTDRFWRSASPGGVRRAGKLPPHAEHLPEHADRLRVRPDGYRRTARR